MVTFSMKLANSSLLLYELEANSADDLHGHDQVHQVSIPLIGAASLQFNTETRRLDPDTRVITSPGNRHRNFAHHDAVRLLIVNVDRTFVDQVYQEETGHEGPVEFAAWGPGSSVGLRKHAELMMRRVVQTPDTWMDAEQWERELVRLLLTLQDGSHTERWSRARPSPDKPALKRALELIHDEQTLDLTLYDLAYAAGVSKAHLIRLFDAYVGKTPGQYLTDVRLARAERMLLGTATPITQIAFSAGFGSLSAFERAFKERYGVSAGTFRKQAK